MAQSEIDEDEDDYRPRREPPAARCCYKGSKHVLLSFESHADMDQNPFEECENTVQAFIAVARSIRPSWFLFTRTGERTADLSWDSSGGETHRRVMAPISYCPFCGNAVPEIELNPDPPQPIFAGVGPGYCGVCDERADSCRCYPPEHHWRIKG